MEEEKLLNSLVFNYLNRKDDKLASLAQKKQPIETLQADSPTLQEMFRFYCHTAPKKGKKFFSSFDEKRQKLANGTDNGLETPQVKNKNEELISKKPTAKPTKDSSSESSEDESVPKKVNGVKASANKKPSVNENKRPKPSSDELDSSEEEAKNIMIAEILHSIAKILMVHSKNLKQVLNKKAKMMNFVPQTKNESDDSSDEEETAPVKKQENVQIKKLQNNKVKKQKESSEDSSDDEDNKKPALKVVQNESKQKAPVLQKKESSSDDRDSDEETVVPVAEKVPVVNGVNKKAKGKKKESSSDEEEEAAKPVKEKNKEVKKDKKEKKEVKKESSSSDDSVEFLNLYTLQLKKWESEK